MILTALDEAWDSGAILLLACIVVMAGWFYEKFK